MLPVIAAVLFVVASYYVTKSIVAILGAFATFTVSTAPGTIAAIGLIGLVTMSIIQVIRFLWPLRGWFHAREMSLQLFGTPTMDRALARLLQLTTPSQATAFWNLPIEQVCGQIGAAVELAFADPETYAILLKTLSGAGYVTPHDRKSRDTVAFFVQRNIDRTQIVTGDRWRRMLRIFAVSLSSALAFAASVAQKTPASFGDWGTVLISSGLIGIVAGYVAMVLRDIVAIIERLRRSS
jgi:hypothetical protein